MSSFSSCALVLDKWKPQPEALLHNVDEPLEMHHIYKILSVHIFPEIHGKYQLFPHPLQETGSSDGLRAHQRTSGRPGGND
jgi:hypothetical protein